MAMVVVAQFWGHTTKVNLPPASRPGGFLLAGLGPCEVRAIGLHIFKYSNMNSRILRREDREHWRNFRTDACRRRGDDVAARGSRAAASDAGDRVLHPQSPDALAEPLRGLHRGLKDTGYSEGANVAINYRWAENLLDRLPAPGRRSGSQTGRGHCRGGRLRFGARGPQPRRSPSSLTSAMSRSGLVLSPASPGRAATSQGSIFSRANWWRSGWSF